MKWDKALEENTFFTKETLQEAIAGARKVYSSYSNF
jgi:hypothetical protein